MAGPKLSAEEKTYLETPPEPTPLDETTGDRTPAEDESESEVPAKAAADDKPKAADDKAKKAEPEKQKSVDFGAFEKERSERKVAQEALRRERQEGAERQARLDERLAIINEALQPQPMPQQPPRPDEDIFGAFEHLSGEVNTLRQERQQEAQRRQQDGQRQQRATAMFNAYRADAARFVAEEPAFKDAYGFLLSSRQAELTAGGWDPATIANTVRNDEMAIVEFALTNGRSPAETLYRMAQARGFKGPEPEKPEVTEPPAASPAANGADKIAQLQSNREAALSLSDGGGSPGGDKITLEAIDRMRPDEFKAFVARLNKNNQKGYDTLMRRLMLGN